MRREVWVSLIACLIGAVIPLVWLGPHLLEGLPPLFAAVTSVVPFILVTGTAWSVRRDPRASRVLAVVALLVLGVALVGWAWAIATDPLWLVPVGLLFVPTAQVLMWLAGAAVSGRRQSP